MGSRSIDFNYIFFGRHENRHKLVTLGVFLIVAFFLVYYGIITQVQSQVDSLERPVKEDAIKQLCSRLSVSSKISCEEAVEIALKAEQGTLRNISIGVVEDIDFSGDKPRIKNEMNWLIDIALANPRFDENFKRDVKLMRVGIGLDESNKIYREVVG